MSEHQTHDFRGCQLRIFPEAEYVETLFPDGRCAGATRDGSVMANVDYARHLGYPDCWTALVAHEAAHTWLMERLGHPYSPTLRAVALGYAPGTAPYEERLAEEALVLAFERFAGTGVSLTVLEHPAIETRLHRLLMEWRMFTGRLFAQLESAA